MRKPTEHVADIVAKAEADPSIYFKLHFQINSSVIYGLPA